MSAKNGQQNGHHPLPPQLLLAFDQALNALQDIHNALTGYVIGKALPSVRQYRVVVTAAHLEVVEKSDT